MALKEYKNKRDFSKTPEPAGAKAGENKSKKPIFVVHRHDATRLHYDFRLEDNGVLKSWAVPKGPSMNTSDKRLAVRTEDHPLDYADFEGIIPEGEYGAGTVIVWDKGTYDNIYKREGKIVSMDKSIKEGHIEIDLDGEKLKGEFSLIKTILGGEEKWLLVKMSDEYAAGDTPDAYDPVAHWQESVMSGKTNDDLKYEEDREEYERKEESGE